MATFGPFDVNNNSDQDNSDGLSYQAASDGAPGTTTIVRQGPVTHFEGTGNLTASRVWTFGTILAQKWKEGDIVFLSLPAHTGGGFTVTVQNIAGGVLSTWAALLSNGGMYIFRGTDFRAMLPGVSTT